jgi:hypothetical protein
LWKRVGADLCSYRRDFVSVSITAHPRPILKSITAFTRFAKR